MQLDRGDGAPDEGDIALDEFCGRLDRFLAEFAEHWRRCRRKDPEFLPDKLAFEDWWRDFQEDVEFLSLRARATNERASR